MSRHVSTWGLTVTRSAISRRVPVNCVTTVESPTVQGTVDTLLTADSKLFLWVTSQVFSPAPLLLHYSSLLCTCG